MRRRRQPPAKGQPPAAQARSRARYIQTVQSGCSSNSNETHTPHSLRSGARAGSRSVRESGYTSGGIPDNGFGCHDSHRARQCTMDHLRKHGGRCHKHGPRLRRGNGVQETRTRPPGPRASPRLSYRRRRTECRASLPFLSRPFSRAPRSGRSCRRNNYAECGRGDEKNGAVVPAGTFPVN